MPETTTTEASIPFDFKALLTGIRPGRIAILVNSEDPEWQRNCLHALEFLSTVWGGKHSLIVPTDGKNIKKQFWETLEAFDPDYICYYRKRGVDISRSDPSQFEKMVDSEMANYDDGFDRLMLREQIAQSLKWSFIDDFEISAELQDELKFRIAPFYFDDHIADRVPVCADLVARYPLTAVHKIMENCDRPTEIIQLEGEIQGIPRIWHCVVNGVFSESHAQVLRDSGLTLKGKTVSQDNSYSLIDSIVNPSSNQNTPFGLTMLQLGEFLTRDFQGWEEPVVVVVGDSIYDFCLYQNLLHIRPRVCWLPKTWVEGFNAGKKRMEAEGIRPSEGERYASHFGAAVLNLLRLPNAKPTAVFVSGTLTIAELETCRISLSDAAMLSSEPLLTMSSCQESIASLVRYPITVYEQGKIQTLVSQPFIRNHTPIVFETPKPLRFKFIDPFEHRWLADISVDGYMLPRHPAIGVFVADSHGLSTEHARVSRAGITYCAINWFVHSTEVDHVLARPKINLPDALGLTQFIAVTTNLRCKASDKGYYLAESIQKFGGLDALTQCLLNNSKKAVLDKYLDETRPAEDVFDEGVFLTDRRRYLDFECVEKILNSSKKDAGLFLDDLVRKSVLYRGYILKCGFCRNADWFSIEELTSEFKCRRCGHVQIYTREHWLNPEEPKWFYKLDEIVYQGYTNNMAVTALTLAYLNRTKRYSFSHTTEMDFFDQATDKHEIEVDFVCVVDGVLAIGEAKKEDCLGPNRLEDEAACLKYLTFAKKIGARKVIFATSANCWSQRTIEKIAQVFSDDRVKYQLLTAAQLLS